MTQVIILPFRLPSLNDYVRAERANRYAAAKMKKDCQAMIRAHLHDLGQLQPVTRPVRLTIDWMEKTARRDCDNVAFGKKFILDSLVAEGILPDDGRKWVYGFVETFAVGETDRILVTIEEERT